MFPIEILVTAFLAVMTLASIISLRARVPYTLILVIIGMALAATTAISVFGQGTFEQVILQMRALFDQLTTGETGGLFVGLVVPPLLFEAMIHIRSDDLKAVIRPSIVLATIGVVIATLVVGIILWEIVGLPFYVSFLFAAVIAPTDVATVLEVFRHAKVPSKLSALMDTEAAFNDATAIVVFSVVIAAISFGGVSLFTDAAEFALVFAGGVGVGLVVAFVAELLTSLVSEKLTETILTISAVYGSYALASSLGVSGLVAVAVVGLYFGNFTIRTAMSPATREAVKLFWEFAAFVGNSIAFLFIGLRTDVFKLASFPIIESILLAYLAVTAARAASTYPILAAFDQLGQKFPLKWKNVIMLGGMRGALSIALAASIPATLISSQDSNLLGTLVLGVAFISLSLQAAMLFRYIKRKFTEEQKASEIALNVRLSTTAAAIETLRKLRDEGKISDEEFALQLDNNKDILREMLSEINATVDPRNIMRRRATELYSSVLTTPVTRARQAFGRGRVKPGEQNQTENSTMPESDQGNNGAQQKEEQNN